MWSRQNENLGLLRYPVNLVRGKGMDEKDRDTSEATDEVNVRALRTKRSRGTLTFYVLHLHQAASGGGTGERVESPQPTR